MKQIFRLLGANQKAIIYHFKRMAKLSCLLTIPLLLFFSMNNINKSSSARNLGNPTSNHHHHHHRRHHKMISFLMQDLVNVTQPVATKVTNQLPFSKPVGFFPPNGGIPIPESDPKVPDSGSSSTRMLDISNLGLYFPARATLQELDFGAVVTIDENLFDGSVNGSPLGKARGLYIASSEDNETCHMLAMTTLLADGKFKDGLRFFGLHRRDVSESHIAVIGGTGKFVGANGYATVKVVDLRSDSGAAEKQGVNKLLSFNVYLS